MPDGDQARFGATVPPFRPPERRGLARLVARLRALDPFVVFLLAAGLIFGAYRAIHAHKPEILVSAAAQRSLADDYELLTGRKPDAARRAKLVRDYVRDELLFREAIAKGMHLTDSATRQRLIDRLRFSVTGAPADPSEEMLVDFYAEHPDLYRSEPQISLEHVFFQHAPADAAAILARLNAGGYVKGDDYWMGRVLDGYGESMLRGMFGQPFLAQLKAAREGTWFGPVASPRGVHFVRVTGRTTPARLPYTQMRDQVRQDYLAAASDAAIDAEVARLAKGYHVVVE